MSKIYCKCGKCVGKWELDRVEKRLKGWGIDNGKVYKMKFTEDVYRDEWGCVRQIGHSNNYYCKECYSKR